MKWTWEYWCKSSFRIYFLTLSHDSIIASDIDVWIDRDSVVVGIVEKSKLLDFSTMLVFWSLFSLVRNSVVLAVYLLFSVTCFFTIHEHSDRGCHYYLPGWISRMDQADTGQMSAYRIHWHTEWISDMV